MPQAIGHNSDPHYGDPPVNTLLEALMNPATMTRPQLLMLVIMLFVVIASLYFVWRLYRIVTTSRKTPYVPNIGSRRAGTTGVRPGARDGADRETTNGSNAAPSDSKRPE